MNIFGRGRAQAGTAGGGTSRGRGSRGRPNVQETIVRMNGVIQTLDKREAHMLHKVAAQDAEARAKLRAKDKRGAMVCLKRKKMFENELTKLAGSRWTLEQQIVQLEATVTTMEVARNMEYGKEAMRAARGGMDADDVADTMDDIREEMDEANAIGDLLGEGLGNDYEDDDELLDELDEVGL